MDRTGDARLVLGGKGNLNPKLGAIEAHQWVMLPSQQAGSHWSGNQQQARQAQRSSQEKTFPHHLRPPVLSPIRNEG